MKKLISLLTCLVFSLSLSGCLHPLAPENFDSSDPFSEVDWDECGFEEGDRACDFVLEDQNGDPWRLYSHYKRADLIVIEVSTMWCMPCRMAASEAQELQDHFGSQLVMPMVMVQNAVGQPPTESDIDTWVESLGIESVPVLAGNESFLDLYPVTGVPTFYFLDENMVIIHVRIGFDAQTHYETIEYFLD